MNWRQPGDEQGRARILVGGAIAAALALTLVYLAAGGASYTPAKVQNPCEHRPWRNPEGLQQIAEQFSLSALDGAACKLGVSRETLARALATEDSRQKFLDRYDISDAELARAIRAGLVRAIDDAEEAGALSPFLAVPMRHHRATPYTFRDRGYMPAPVSHITGLLMAVTLPLVSGCSTMA